MADNLEQILETTEAERLATGFVFTEGPLWHPDGYWLFVDVRREPGAIFRLTPGGAPEIYREPSNGSNGLTFDLQGRIIMCEGDGRRMSRREHDGSIVALAEQWDGKRLSRPNDVVCHSDGSIYFTNPGGRVPPEEREIDFSGVHRIAPDGTVTAVVTDTEYPNGWPSPPMKASSTSPIPGSRCTSRPTTCSQTARQPTAGFSPTCHRTILTACPTG